MPGSRINQLSLKVAELAAEPGDSQSEQYRKSLLFVANIIFPLVVVAWLVTFILYDEPSAGAAPATYIIISYALLAIFLFTRRYQILVFSQQIMILLLPFVVMFALGGYAPSSAVIVWSLLSPLGTLVVVGPRSARIWLLAYLALVLLGGFLDPLLSDSENLPATIVLLFFIMNIGFVSTIVFITLYYFVNDRDKNLKLLLFEQDRSERLLLNVLPKEIVTILKNEEGTVAQRFDDASILFADLVGFTPLSVGMPPESTVELLNEIFSHFDMLVDDYALEKIRTIGDNYMVASGVPHPRSDHAQALAGLALDMSHYLSHRPAVNGQAIDFRIGINSGPVVGGVIGRSKFHYDVWGDAVNIASRMESHGLPGRIQISAATNQLIEKDFYCQPRGLIEVKGKGEMNTWFLVGRKQHSFIAPPQDGTV